LNLIQGQAETTGAAISSAVQATLAIVLIALALALVRLGYQSITEARGGPETPAAEPGDD
jgi:carbon starvation protein